MDLTYACVCCGYRTLSEPPGSHEICPVCGWEDDVYQLRWPYRPDGANDSSLLQAQRGFAASGHRGAGFEREPSWRPIDVDRDRFEPDGGPLARWPEDRTVLYWWRARTGTTWWEQSPPAVLEFDREAAPFADAVRAVAAAAPPADPENLSGMAVDFDHYLRRCPSIRHVAVSTGPDPARQLTARCLADPASAPHRVAAEIERTWLRELRYAYWEAHLLRVDSASVGLDVATMIGEGGYYIAGSIIVTWPAPAPEPG